jgi:restriction system protein
MSGIWFNPTVLADTLSETVGYKAGLALSVAQMCDHLSETEYSGLILASEKHVVRVRSEEYEALFYKLLHRVGYTDEEYDGDILGVRLFHKYKNEYRQEYDGVLKLFVGIFPQLLNETMKKGGKLIDPSPLLHACFETYGEIGVKIAIEKLGSMNRGLHLNPHSRLRYRAWENTETLDSLFSGGVTRPEQGEFIDQRFIDYLSKNRDRMEEIHWRKFEELTAEYFARAGFQVKLGPGQNDDGVDVRIWRTDQNTEQTPHCIIQCKRQKHKVEKVVVKGLFADIQFENADYGLIVTTSELSPGARKTIAVRGYPIEEVNKTALADWLAELRTPGSGIVRV